MSLPVMSAQYAADLKAFETKILNCQMKIEAWFREQWGNHYPPFYGSVDIRNSGYKMASIDMNLFPGGFNNLNPHFIPLAAVAAQDAVERACETAKSVLIIPENHTRNTYYLQNVMALSNILRSAGFEVRLGSLNPEITELTELKTALGDTIIIEPLLRTRDRVHLADGFSRRDARLRGTGCGRSHLRHQRRIRTPAGRPGAGGQSEHSGRAARLRARRGSAGASASTGRRASSRATGSEPATRRAHPASRAIGSVGAQYP